MLLINTYNCRTVKYVVIGVNVVSNFKRLMVVAGYPEMADDPRMATNAGRVVHQQAIDEALANWCESLSSPQVLEQLEQARVPAGPIYDVADLMAVPHFQERGLFEQVDLKCKPVKIPVIVPRLVDTPG